MLEFVIDRLVAEAERSNLRNVASESGVAYGTCKRILRRETGNPTIDNVQRLYDYFRRTEQPAAPETPEAA